ncbi:MAG TPA: hypothetical protein VLX91_12440 [Candidatus Acidoferrales bacterium]|nr:hypothetical protein [Candidatus Acidoferrales bacterium]
MRYIKIAAFVFSAILATATLSFAQDNMKDMKGMSTEKDKGANATTTIQGEVVDMACYMTKGQHGADHADCAQMCINSGLPVGILDKSGHVYLCMMSNHKSANSSLVQYAAKQVKVTGTVFKKGGMDLLAVDKVEPLESDTGTK